MSVNLNEVVKARVRLEGCTNQMWSLTMKDGSVLEYYAIEGSPQVQSTDERVYDIDRPLGLFLNETLEALQPCSRHDEDYDTIEYTVDFERHMIYEVVIQDHRGPDKLMSQRMLCSFDSNNKVTILSEDFRSFEQTKEKLVFSMSHYFEPGAMVDFMRQWFMADIKEWMRQRDPEHYTDTDAEEFFMMGSEGLMELGLVFTWRCDSDGNHLTVE